MADLESLIRQVWNPDVRPLAEEAWRCYNSGAIRASIAATWTAVAADIITKLVRLADEGDGSAVAFRDEVRRAHELGISSAGVEAAQKIESKLLDTAAAFELIDSIGKRELGRIREDRNLCAHPSLRHLGGVYQPRPEVARSHLAVALEALLAHPPTQGGKLLNEFIAYICDPSFSPTAQHAQAEFFDRARTASRRTIVKFTAKHALLELDPDGLLPAAEHADRMAVTLDAFAERDRVLVGTAVEEQRDKFSRLSGEVLLRALVRLGDHDYFWNAVAPALAARLQDLLRDALNRVDEYEPLPDDVAASIAIVRSKYARDRLPVLQNLYDQLSVHRQMSVVATSPHPYFVPSVRKFLREAWSWNQGGKAGDLLVRHALFLDADNISTALTEWAQNYECRTAHPMQGLAVELFHRTAHVGANRKKLFSAFVTMAQEQADLSEDRFRYETLEQVLAAVQE